MEETLQATLDCRMNDDKIFGIARTLKTFCTKEECC